MFKLGASAMSSSTDIKTDVCPLKTWCNIYSNFNMSKTNIGTNLMKLVTMTVEFILLIHSHPPCLPEIKICIKITFYLVHFQHLHQLQDVQDQYGHILMGKNLKNLKAPYLGYLSP